MIVGDGVLLKVTAPTANIVLSSKVKSFAGGAFDSANIQTIKLSSAITKLPEYAFSGCTDLTEVTGGNINSIGKRAFNGCFKIKSFNAGSASVDAEAYEFISSSEEGYFTPGTQSRHILLPRCNKEPQMNLLLLCTGFAADCDKHPASAVPAENAPAPFKNSRLVFILRSMNCD